MVTAVNTNNTNTSLDALEALLAAEVPAANADSTAAALGLPAVPEAPLPHPVPIGRSPAPVIQPDPAHEAAVKAALQHQLLLRQAADNALAFRQTELAPVNAPHLAHREAIRQARRAEESAHHGWTYLGLIAAVLLRHPAGKAMDPAVRERLPLWMAAAIGAYGYVPAPALVPDYVENGVALHRLTYADAKSASDEHTFGLLALDLEGRPIGACVWGRSRKLLAYVGAGLPKVKMEPMAGLPEAMRLDLTKGAPEAWSFKARGPDGKLTEEVDIESTGLAGCLFVNRDALTLQ